MTICTLSSSSSGNCTIVSHGDTHILIDAGMSLRRTKESLRELNLSPSMLACVLITHEHSDHISGLPMLLKYHKTSVFTSFGTGNGICGIIPEAEPFINCFEPGTELELGDICVKSFRTPHDSSESLGFTLSAGGKRLVYATDLGCVTAGVMEAALGADVAIIEANHDLQMLKNGPYPPFLKARILSDYGHLENSDCGEFAARLAHSGTRHIQLAHLSRTNNTPELAYNTVRDVLKANGVKPGKDVSLDVTPHFTSGRVYKL